MNITLVVLAFFFRPQLPLTENWISVDFGGELYV